MLKKIKSNDLFNEVVYICSCLLPTCIFLSLGTINMVHGTVQGILYAVMILTVSMAIYDFIIYLKKNDEKKKIRNRHWVFTNLFLVLTGVVVIVLHFVGIN